MSQADTFPLTEADLERVQGGLPVDPHANVPEDSRGKPLFPLSQIPDHKLPKLGSVVPVVEPTPPIIIIDAPVA
jgi:hypothetical protein